MNDRKWNPVNTAPVDVWLLVRVGGEDVPAIAKAWKSGMDTVEHWTWCSDLRFAQTERGGVYCVLENVTHWMELPGFFDVPHGTKE